MARTLSMLKTKLRRLRNDGRKLFRKIVFWGNPNFHELSGQIDRHFEHLQLDNAIVHVHRILPQIRRLGLDRKARVLCIGCCNMLEIYAFKSYGFENVVGIDLVSSDPRFIKVMDMHDLKFADSTFDLIYMSGSFHCTYDVRKLILELVRVTKSKGWISITVPVQFPINNVYKLDIQDLEHLHQLFQINLNKVLWSEEVAPDTEFNSNKNKIVRTIFSVTK